MKKLLLVGMLALVGCSNSPKFKVGDCFYTGHKVTEEWEKDYIDNLYKVVSVGKESYQVALYLDPPINVFVLNAGKDGHLNSRDIWYSDFKGTKIDCPDAKIVVIK